MYIYGICCADTRILDMHDALDRKLVLFLIKKLENLFLQTFLEKVINQARALPLLY